MHLRAGLPLKGTQDGPVEQAEENITTFNKDKCEVLPLEQKSSLQQAVQAGGCQAGEQLCSPEELVVLVDSELNVSLQYAPAQQHAGQ